MTSSPTVFEGHLTPPQGARFALVSSRFNDFIVARLLEGCIDALVRHGVPHSEIDVIKVPGAFELPLACQHAARTGRYAAVVALGAVIRGSTPHFDYVAAECVKGCAAVALDSDVPVSLGVLTTDTIEQAVERAGTKAGNKGAEAALSALEMVGLRAALQAVKA